MWRIHMVVGLLYDHWLLTLIGVAVVIAVTVIAVDNLSGTPEAIPQDDEKVTPRKTIEVLTPFEQWETRYCTGVTAQGEEYNIPFNHFYVRFGEPSEWEYGWDGNYPVPDMGDTLTYRYQVQELNQFGTYEVSIVRRDYDHACEPVPESWRVELIGYKK